MQCALVSLQVPCTKEGGGPDLAGTGARSSRDRGKQPSNNVGIMRGVQIFQPPTDGRLRAFYAAEAMAWKDLAASCASKPRYVTSSTSGKGWLPPCSAAGID